MPMAKLTVRQLRQLIEGEYRSAVKRLREMKLGIAGSERSGHAWGEKDVEPESEPRGPMLEPGPHYEVDPETVKADRAWQSMHSPDMDWDDEWRAGHFTKSHSRELPMKKKRGMEEVYMKPSHMRGIGPEIDLEPGRRGKLTTDQAMHKFPEAMQSFYDEVKEMVQADAEEFGDPVPRYPKDVLDGWIYYEVNGKLVSTDGGAAWMQWDPRLGHWGDVEEGGYPKGVHDYGRYDESVLRETPYHPMKELSWEDLKRISPEAFKALRLLRIDWEEWQAMLIDPLDDSDAVDIDGERWGLGIYPIDPEIEEGYEWSPSIGEWQDITYHS